MTNNSNKSPHALLLGLAGTLWLIVALVGYFYTHKPFEIAFISSTLIALWRLIVTAGIIALSGGIGAWILSRLKAFPKLTNMAV